MFSSLYNFALLPEIQLWLWPMKHTSRESKTKRKKKRKWFLIKSKICTTWGQFFSFCPQAHQSPVTGYPWTHSCRERETSSVSSSFFVQPSANVFSRWKEVLKDTGKEVTVTGLAIKIISPIWKSHSECLAVFFTKIPQIFNWDNLQEVINVCNKHSW